MYNLMYRIQAIAYILPFDRYSVLKFIKRSKCVRIFNKKLKHKKETKKKKNNEIKRKKNHLSYEMLFLYYHVSKYRNNGRSKLYSVYQNKWKLSEKKTTPFIWSQTKHFNYEIFNLCIKILMACLLVFRQRCWGEYSKLVALVSLLP